MRKALSVLLFLLIGLTASAQESQTVYNFLRLPASAHGAALGGDNITLIDDDASLVFANPALLSSVTDKTIGLNYMNYMGGANMLSASFNRTVKERASWAATAQYINYGNMKEMDANGQQTGEFSAKDIALGGYFSYMLTDRLAGGVAVKFITSYIASYSSLAAGVDLGLNYYDADRELSLSLAARNLGGQLKAFNDDYESLPIDVQLGLTKRLTHTPFRVSLTLVDLNHLNYRFIDHAVAGIDLLLGENIWVGGGYNFRRAREMKTNVGTDQESSHGAGLSLGAGINLERFHINLAYGKYHVSSSSVAISMGYSL